MAGVDDSCRYPEEEQVCEDDNQELQQNIENILMVTSVNDESTFIESAASYQHGELVHPGLRKVR